MIREKTCKCKSCDRLTGYTYDTAEGKCPETFKCKCGGKAEWTFEKRNHIHTEISSLYDRRDGFGGVDPRFGVPVKSYQEKQALLRERGLEETQVERFDDIQNDVAEQQAKQAERKNGAQSALVADSVDELMERINTDKIDRRATGTLTGRAGQDPDSGLIDGFGSKF